MEHSGHLLALEQLLDCVTSMPGHVRLTIETEYPTRHSVQVESALVAMLRRFQVHVWTVNRPQDMEFVLSLEVDAVITDHPGALLARLGRGPAVPRGGPADAAAQTPPSVRCTGLPSRAERSAAQARACERSASP